MILMMIMMMIFDESDHKNDSYTAAGPAPGASIINI